MKQRQTATWMLQPSLSYWPVVPLESIESVKILYLQLFILLTLYEILAFCHSIVWCIPSMLSYSRIPLIPFPAGI